MSATGERLVRMLDPDTALVRGALPYHDAPAALPDEQPLPGLQVRRAVAVTDAVTLEVEQRLGDQVLATERLALDAVPLDRTAAVPRRRVHPASTAVLHVAVADAVDELTLDAVDTDVAGRTVARLPRHGVGPHELDRLEAAARRHRLVSIDGPLPPDPLLAAAIVLRVVAGGTPCLVESTVADGLELLHPDLRRALHEPLVPGWGARLLGQPSTDDAPTIATDDLLLARAAADQRRAAWTHHDLRLVWEPAAGGSAAAPGSPDAWEPSLRPPPVADVSIVLATRRPEWLPAALGMIARQRGVRLEVVVALHGAGDVSRAEALLRSMDLPGDVVAVPAAVPFGAVLQAAVGRTTGALVLKWDDDDLYGPDHVLDLVIAQRQTGAGLVGKAPEFVHLDASTTTIWRTPGRAEADSPGIAGGTFLTPRAALDALGGYPPVARAVDFHLKVRARDHGQRVFRTHGFGFVLRRHAAGHTWEADDRRFLDQAVRRFDGLPPVLDLGELGDLPG